MMGCRRATLIFTTASKKRQGSVRVCQNIWVVLEKEIENSRGQNRKNSQSLQIGALGSCRVVCKLCSMPNWITSNHIKEGKFETLDLDLTAGMLLRHHPEKYKFCDLPDEEGLRWSRSEKD